MNMTIKGASPEQAQMIKQMCDKMGCDCQMDDSEGTQDQGQDGLLSHFGGEND